MKARITFYQINRCGLYNSSKSKTPLFLGIKDVLIQLTQWGIGKDLSQTDIFKNANNNDVCTYLADIQSTTNSTILVMWNRVPSTDAGVLSLPNNSKVGQIIQADANRIKPNSIPGYPTYFWFIPDKNIFATICFNTNVNGRQNMETYLKEFMQNFSDNVVKELNQDTNTVEIKGYSKAPNNTAEKVYEHTPTFKANLYPKPQKLDIIKRKAPEIRKITKKAAANYRTQISQRMFQQAIGFFYNIKRTPMESDKFTIKIETSIPNGLTEQEVDNLHEEWLKDLDFVHTLDYGFKLGSEQFWFSHSLAKWEGDLSLSFTEQNSFGNMDKLLKELDVQKDTILSAIT